MLFVHTVNFELPTGRVAIVVFTDKKARQKAEFLGRRHRLPDGKNKICKF